MEEQKILSTLRENYNGRIEDVDFMRESGGRTYVVKGDGKKYLLKIAGGAFSDTVRQSVDVMCYLSECGFPVPPIVKTKSGLPMLEISDEGKTELFVLYEYLEGEEPDLCVCGRDVGELAGRLHKLLLNYRSELIERDERFFIGRYLDILRRKDYPRTEAYADLGARLWKRVKDCPVSVCHGDLHRGNLLETADREIYLLDFDTICRAPHMFDVAVMCDMTDCFDLRPDDVKTTRAVYESFLDGYSRFVDLSEQERQSFDDWVAIRHFQLQATIVEIYGIDCIDESFIDRQFGWLESWQKVL